MVQADTGDSPEGEGESELLRAGAELVGRGEFAAALWAFEEAERVETGDLRVCAMVDVATVLDQLGDHAGAAAKYRAALAQMTGPGPRMRPGAWIGLSQALQHLGDLDGAQDALERARVLVAEDGAPGEMRFAALVAATALAVYRQQWSRAIELANESLGVAVRYVPDRAGHALMNLAAAHFETGRWELAEDFAGQALVAFDAAGARDGVAEAQLNLALMFVRAGRFDDIEPVLRPAQEYFEAAGVTLRAGVGRKLMGFLAEHRGEHAAADVEYRAALASFEASGAIMEAAEVRTRLASVAMAAGRFQEAEAEVIAARTVFAERGLGLHCAQMDFWLAELFGPLLESVPGLLARAVDLALPAALALDAVRYELPDGAQRENWNRRVADPAMRVAFHYAYLAGDGRLIADLIETQCAGTTLDISRLSAPPVAPFEARRPVTPPPALSGPTDDALQLGTALAAVAATAGLPVAPPPRVAVGPDGHIALAAWIAAAEGRYGRPLRDNRLVRS
ncbi:tetratricopeptide repeat protein [Nocardia yamanashiensis]|uniref:tetratricopeptide repeat protein n=1 Tax=Nocardia yamanashiensis TaxID=209247 RepID=UPI001E41D281|nr:tetratricopeptide repeat protein [Nocardia yamanashiensis]UGT45394.1 tetratricopeptide repeat protein [Nocardia yamanashiensis]